MLLLLVLHSVSFLATSVFISIWLDKQSGHMKKCCTHTFSVMFTVSLLTQDFPLQDFFFFFWNTMSIIHWHCAWLSVWCITVSHSTGHANQHNLLSTCAPFLQQRRTGCETWTWWHWHCDIDTPMTISLHSSSVIDSYFNISTAILLLSYCHSSWTVMVFSYEYDTW